MGGGGGGGSGGWGCSEKDSNGVFGADDKLPETSWELAQDSLKFGCEKQARNFLEPQAQ